MFKSLWAMIVLRSKQMYLLAFGLLTHRCTSRKTVKTTEQNARAWGSGDMQFTTFILLMRKPGPWALNWLIQYLTDGSLGNKTVVSIPPVSQWIRMRGFLAYPCNACNISIMRSYKPLSGISLPLSLNTFLLVQNEDSNNLEATFLC